jgi:hypothetical protein
MGERVEGEENGPYRRLTIEWYKDLETGTFLAKLTVEGESVKEGKMEAEFTFSGNEKIDIDSLTLSNLDKVLDDNYINPLVNYIAAELIRSILMETGNTIEIDNFVSGFIGAMAEIIARIAMAFDANKLRAMMEKGKGPESRGAVEP